MKKRKRGSEEKSSIQPTKRTSHQARPEIFSNGATTASSKQRHIQIITGSYDRVLHGFIATIPAGISQIDNKTTQALFRDNFLFTAHSSSIRCLALCPASTSGGTAYPGKVILASGGTDERINLYHISGSLPDSWSGSHTVKYPESVASAPGAKLEDSRNKELGSLLHHASSVNVLHFVNRSKFLSGADDNTIAISRTRDWTVLSTIKIPSPKAAGRPSGDTAPPGGAPSGVNDFTVHPSQKLMISVGKGEKCMRLWNLVTGKKAGVLDFDKELLRGVGEGKWSRGEARRVEWNPAGTEFAVAFERGIALFGMKCEPKGFILPEPSAKVHQIHYVQCNPSNDSPVDLLAVSAEDGRVLFYSTAMESSATSLAIRYRCLGTLGESRARLEARVKDFECLEVDGILPGLSSKVFVLARSDGTVELWHVTDATLLRAQASSTFNRTESSTQEDGEAPGKEAAEGAGSTKSPLARFGDRLGVYKTNSRITCMKAIELKTANKASSQSSSDGGFEGFGSSSE